MKPPEDRNPQVTGFELHTHLGLILSHTSLWLMWITQSIIPHLQSFKEISDSLVHEEQITTWTVLNTKDSLSCFTLFSFLRLWKDSLWDGQSSTAVSCMESHRALAFISFLVCILFFSSNISETSHQLSFLCRWRSALHLCLSQSHHRTQQTTGLWPRCGKLNVSLSGC